MLAHDNRTAHPSVRAADIWVSARRHCDPAKSFAPLQPSRVPESASTRRRVGNNVSVEPNDCVAACDGQFRWSVAVGRHRNFVRHGGVHRWVRRGDRYDDRYEDEVVQMHGA